MLLRLQFFFIPSSTSPARSVTNKCHKEVSQRWCAVCGCVLYHSVVGTVGFTRLSCNSEFLLQHLSKC